MQLVKAVSSANEIVKNFMYLFIIICGFLRGKIYNFYVLKFSIFLLYVAGTWIVIYYSINAYITIIKCIQ